MSPEYRLYFPPGSEGQLKDFVHEVKGARIISHKVVQEDFTFDQTPEMARESLIIRTRETLSKLPRDTTAGSLIRASRRIQRLSPLWEFSSPQEWSNYFEGLNRSEKSRITKALRVVQVKGSVDLTLDEVSRLNWGEIVQTPFRNISPAHVELARRIFQAPSD